MEHKKLKLLFEIVIPKYDGDKNNFVQRVNEYMARGEPVTEEEKKRWNDAARIIEQGGGGQTLTAGENISITPEGVISVLTADEVESDNTRPITSAAVDKTVGNIEILLKTI